MLAAPLVALLLYLPGFRNGFVWDDHLLIEQNPLLRSGTGLWRALTVDFWAASNGVDASGLWRPLITLSYALDGALSRWNAGWFHAMNTLAHAAASALVSALALGAGATPLAGALAGILFASIPAHVESVGWIAGRSDVYCAVFLLLALLLDRRARAAGRRSPGAWPLVALALALLSKETALCFVAVVAVAEQVGLGTGPKPRLRSSARWLAPYAALTVLFLLVHAAMVRSPQASVAPALGQRVTLMALMFPGYLSFAWPWHAAGAAFEPTGATAWAVAAAVGLDVAFVVWLGWLIWRRASVALPLALFWLTLLPLMLANLAHGYVLFAERYFYLPSAGLAWAAATGCDALRGSPRLRLAALAGLALVAIGGGGVVVSLLPAWRDDAVLFESMVRRAPRNYLARTQWARQLAIQGRDSEAARELDAAVAIDATRSEVPSLQAYLAYRRGDWSTTLTLAELAIARGSSEIEPRLLRAGALLLLGRVGEGRAALEELRQRTPGQPLVEVVWGQYLLQYGQPGEAYPVLLGVQHVAPEDAGMAFKFGLAAAGAGHPEEARTAFERAVRLDPGQYDGWLELARVRTALGDRAGAEAALARALSLPAAADGRAAALRAQLGASR